MTRKSKKGIVGKTTTAGMNNGEIGPGLDLVAENLTNGLDIEAKVKEEMGAKHARKNH